MYRRLGDGGDCADFTSSGRIPTVNYGETKAAERRFSRAVRSLDLSTLLVGSAVDG